MKYKELISKMTLEEKASLMSGKDFWQSMDIERLGVPNMFLADGPHGIRKQMAAADHLGLNASYPATCFPTAATMANSWDEQLGEELATCLGAEAASLNVNVLLGPGTNMKRNPLCGRNFEYFSEDPYLAGKMAAAYVRGIQSNGISACLKHYAANNQEKNRMTIDTIVDERTLREVYLTAFEIGIKEGKAKTIMSSYNKINGTYTNESLHLMREILRDEWGFDGVVVTDWGGSNDRVEGLRAGNELEMPTTGGETNRDIIAAIKKGNLDESVLDECVDRLLTLVYDTEKGVKAAPDKTFDAEGHHEIARKAAESSIVLLKNKENVLPLSGNEKIAVIGDFADNPRYQGAGSSIVNPTFLDKPLSFVKEYFPGFVGFEAGFKRYGNKKKGLIKKAVKLALKADVILLYLGLDEITESEGLDRKNMLLPKNQQDLLKELAKLNKKIVVILSCGSALEMDWEGQTDAIAHGYLGGQAGAKAMLNVIRGFVNPSGKLSETYPIKYEDCPSCSNFQISEVSTEYRESIFIGYRYFDTASVPVRFPFGYGLSYTTFALSDVKFLEKGVSFSIANTGTFDGAEVIQLYVGLKNSKIFRANKELKGFKKIFLKPGESKEAFIPFDDKTFRYFNTLSNNWETEGGTYSLYLGNSVQNILFNGELTVDGTCENFPYDSKKLASYFSGKTANVSKEEFCQLIEREVPNNKLDFYKKNRIVVHYNTTVAQLRYSRRWVGRLFSGGITFACKFLRGIGKRQLSNVLLMGVFYQPMRGLSRMTGGALSFGQLDALIYIFNGHFFKGLNRFFKEGKKKKRLIKQEKKLLKASKN